MKNFFAVAFVVLFCVSSSAFAGLFVDIIAIPGIGYDVDPDGKRVVVQWPRMEAVVQLQIWATLTSPNGVQSPADDYFQTLAGAVRQYHLDDSGTGALSLTDATTKGYDPLWNRYQNSAVSVTPDLIGQDSSATTVGCLNWSSATPQYPTTNPQSWLLGTVNYTATIGYFFHGVPYSLVNFSRPYRSTATGAMGFLGMKIDGAAYNGKSNSGNQPGLLDIGIPVAFYNVPELSTLALLGMGTIGLIFFGWRKRR